MITDEQKLSLLQMGIKYAETYDEAHDIADFIFGNDEVKPVGFGSSYEELSNGKRSTDITAHPDITAETEDGQVLTAQPADAKGNAGLAENGLYIAYMDGSYDRYTGENTVRSRVQGIGIQYYDHFFIVGLRDAGWQPLFKNSRDKDDPHVVYHPTEFSALDDWDCMPNDSNMKLHGVTFELPRLMFVPTLAQLFLIGMYAKCGELNEALELVGGEPVKTSSDGTSDYWSSTECDQLHVWGVNMHLGLIYPFYNPRLDCLSIRPIYI